MEVIAGVSSILQIIDSVTRVAKRLNEVRESYNNVALNTALVEGQLFTIRAALEALYEWRASDRDSSRPSKQLDKDLEMSLRCCAILISVIDGKLDESGCKPGPKQKIKYLWLEDILKEYVSNLEGQVRALQLLLTIFQCRTEAEKRQKLENEESRTIMEQVRAETASLAMGNRDFPETGSILSLDPSVTFDIDSMLMESPAYKRVYGHARLRRSPAANASPSDYSEQAACPAPTPSSNKPFQPPPLPSRPAPNPMPQSRDRITVGNHYPKEEGEEENGDGTIMAGSSGVFELSAETKVSNNAWRRIDKSNEAHNSVLQHRKIPMERSDEDVRTTGVAFSTDSISKEDSLPVQPEKIVATAAPAAVDDHESGYSFKRFKDQLNLAFAEKSDERDLGLLYGASAALEAGQSHSVPVHDDNASQVISRTDSNGLDRYANAQSDDLGLTLSRRKSLQEYQKPMSTHSSLYEVSIVPDPQGRSTGTSSPYSCISCKIIDPTDDVSEKDPSKAAPRDLERSSLQSDSESANIQPDTTDKNLINTEIPDQRQQDPISAIAVNPEQTTTPVSNEVPTLFPESKSVEQHTHDKDLMIYSTALAATSESETFELDETPPPAAGLGLQRLESSEFGGAHSEVTEETYSGSHGPGDEVPKSEQFTFLPDRRSYAHEATSTISYFEPPEDSTDSSLRQSTSNTTATSISTHAPGSDLDQTLPDLRRLQNEVATARARGDSRAVQDVLQRSIETVSRNRSVKPLTEDRNAPKQPPKLRFGRAGSNIMHFPSLISSTKGVRLGDSAASGDTALVQDLLTEKVNVDSRSDSFKTPLMRAAMNGHIECMKLLKHFAADELAVDAEGRTALHIAVASNQLAVVKWLLENYPPPSTDLLRHRPSILFRATDAVKGVRSQKNLREASDVEGSKPLHIAAEFNKGGVLETLVAAGVEIESKDNRGRTSFHRAILAKRRDSFDILLQNGAQIASVDARSVSSLHLAAEAGQVDMIETLLENGAKRWDFDADGNQPIHSAVSGGNIFVIETLVTERTDLDKRTKSGQTLLHLACLKKDLEIATYLLKKLVNVNPWAAPNHGVLQALSQSRIKGSSMTPLHYACCMRDFEMAVLLLDHNAWINAPTPEGATALMMAVENEDTNIVNLLLQRGAKVNAKIPGSLVTALHLAARRGDLETVQQLCRKGADFRARTNNSSYGKSPLEQCLKCPNKKKSEAVQAYLRTIVNNNRNNILRANARNLQAHPTESTPPYHNPSGAQIPPLTDPVSYAPWARAQQGYITQQPQAQAPQYYHPDFDVPDEILPPYEPGPSIPARLANQAPVHREQNA